MTRDYNMSYFHTKAWFLLRPQITNGSLLIYTIQHWKRKKTLLGKTHYCLVVEQLCTRKMAVITCGSWPLALCLLHGGTTIVGMSSVTPILFHIAYIWLKGEIWGEPVNSSVVQDPCMLSVGKFDATLLNNEPMSNVDYLGHRERKPKVSYCAPFTQW